MIVNNWLSQVNGNPVKQKRWRVSIYTIMRGPDNWLNDNSLSEQSITAICSSLRNDLGIEGVPPKKGFGTPMKLFNLLRVPQNEQAMISLQGMAKLLEAHRFIIWLSLYLII